MAWQNPVYDRTFADVEEARRKIREWTEEDSPQTADLKGCLNLSDLNRIEGNMAYLAEIFCKMQYPVDVAEKTWESNDIPFEEDIRRILYNLDCLSTLFRHFSSPHKAPDDMSSYQQINDMEYIQAELYLFLQSILNCSQKCAVFQCGNKRILPLKR